MVECEQIAVKETAPIVKTENDEEGSAISQHPVFLVGTTIRQVGDM